MTWDREETSHGLKPCLVALTESKKLMLWTMLNILDLGRACFPLYQIEEYCIWPSFMMTRNGLFGYMRVGRKGESWGGKSRAGGLATDSWSRGQHQPPSLRSCNGLWPQTQKIPTPKNITKAIYIFYVLYNYFPKPVNLFKNWIIFTLILWKCKLLFIPLYSSHSSVCFHVCGFQYFYCSRDFISGSRIL